MKKKKMGFTLVELLAVVVILTVMIVIAIPKINDAVENSRKATFEASAKTIAVAAEKRKMENDILSILGNNETISCGDVVSINDVDYSNCIISFDGDTAKVSMIGSGKFEGLQIVNGTKEDTKVEQNLIVDYIRILYSDEKSRTSNFLKKDNTKDSNIRYYGSNPNNYVKFKDSEEKWRIIGVFGGSVKLVKSSSIGNKEWSAGVSGINNGEGINQWGKSTYESGEEYAGADLQVYLNGDYYNSLSEITKLAIDKHLWNIAGVENSNRSNTIINYNAERGKKTGKECTSGDTCNDTVKRTTEWEGFVALPYLTDYIYASATNGCESTEQRNCANDNWMNNGFPIWFLSSRADLSSSCQVWMVFGDGFIDSRNTTFSFNILPSFYLKSNVKIVSGSGLSTNPYILDIE